jgi:hypothetical protein
MGRPSHPGLLRRAGLVAVSLLVNITIAARDSFRNRNAIHLSWINLHGMLGKDSSVNLVCLAQTPFKNVSLLLHRLGAR